jgi:hypothetical protein
MMRFIVRHLILLLAFAYPAQAGGEWRGGDDPFIDDEPAFYAKGCYWRAGTRYCSQYCYLEINGKRYCHERERVAVPQGDPYALERPTVEEIYRRRPHSYR